jgi:endoglucanase
MRTSARSVFMLAWAIAGCGAGPTSSSTVSPPNGGDEGGAAGSDASVVPGSGSDAGGGGASDVSEPSEASAPSEGGSAGGLGLHASGNQIVDGNGKQVRLLGVNRSGSEYSCIQGNGFFDGPVDQASITSILSWKANAVRVPLNEDCWLAINGAPAAYSGSAYQQAIASYVDLLLSNGIYPILELHWTAPGTTQATQQVAMPDQDHSVTFWSEVAAKFGSNGNIVFEMFNEPFPDSNQDTTAAWTCWRDGGTCPGITYQAAGMQDLVSAVRTAGAKNLVLLGGVEYSNALSQWLAYEPTDPLGNLAAAWHIYDFNTCNTTACYDQYAGVVAQKVPIVATEIGEQDCAGGFITTLMGWLDTKQQNYLGWTWDAWSGCLVLITDYTGTPAGTYGQTYKAHLLATPH